MKCKLLLFLLTLFLIVGCGQQNQEQQHEDSYGKPLVILVETDPWAMVIGSDVPSFVIYETGQIIYKQIENKHLKFYEVILSKSELQNIIKSLGITDSIYKLPDHIDASSWTDQPENELTINLDSLKIISVYGCVGTDTEVRAVTPKPFLTIYDNIKKYRNKKAKEWLPSKIEVMFWDYDYAPNKRPWITGFPDLNSPTTIKRGDDYSVFIDKKDYDKFKKYYSLRGEKEAVEINGKKMAIAYRLPFPNIK